MKKKTIKKLLIGMMILSLSSANMLGTYTPVFATDIDEGRVATEDETYYAVGFHSQSSDKHYANLNHEFDFKMVIGYTFEKKLDATRERRSITLNKNDFIRRGDGYYRTKKPYSKYLLSKDEYNLISTSREVLLLDTESNNDRYLGYGSHSGDTERWNGNDLKVQVIRNVVRVLNRNIEKVAVDYEGQLKQVDKQKLIENIKKANPNMNGNAIYLISGEYIDISNVGREALLKILMEDLVKRVKHTETMTDLSKDDISTLEETVKNLQNRISTLEENIGSKDNLNEELQTKLERLEREKNTLQEELATLQRTLEEKIGNIADLKVEITRLETRITDLEKEVSNLQKEKENLTNENTTLQNEKTELERQITEKDDLIRTKESKITELSNEIVNLNNQKENLTREKTTLETEKENLLQNSEVLSSDIVKKDKLIQEKAEKIRELENRISTLEQEKNTLEEEKTNIQNQNSLLNNQLTDKDKLIKSKEDNITKLEEAVNKLNEKASCSVNPNEITNITKSIKSLEEEISNLKDELKKAKINLPKDIKIGQWYPETIIKYPTKRKYMNNEAIDLSGMKFHFAKYVKENDGYKMLNEEVDYETFKNEIHGWVFKLKTPKAIYNSDSNGKMQIKFSFVLKNEKKSME